MITKKIVIFLIIIFLISLLISVYWVLNKERYLANRIYPNVFIDQIDFGSQKKETIVDYYQRKNDQLKSIKFYIYFRNNKDEPIATFSAKKIGIGYSSQEIANKAYRVGRTSNLLTQWPEKIFMWLNLKKTKIPITINYNQQKIKDFISLVEENYNKPAKDALFSFENGKVVSFQREEKGIEIERERFLNDFEKKILTLKNRVEDKTILLRQREIDPEITLAKANKFGIEELIGIGKSDFTHSASERIHNIILASSKFNGILIPKDKLFSFNQTVGDISSHTGYKSTYIIKDGRTILGDGGGVCQVSTTLFRGAINAGLPIIERKAHSYRVSYYENDSKPGFDATVFAPSVDLKIKNDTPSYILIQTEIDKDNKLLYFRLYGKKDNRKIEISPITVYDVRRPPEPLYQDDPTLKKGIIKQIDFAAWGSKAYFTYKVTKDTQIIFNKKFYSVYRPWQAVYLVGRGE